MHAAAKKQEKANKRAMAERDEQMRTAEGMFYTQPLPRQTNEAWRSEIDLGVERPSLASDRKVALPSAPHESRASTGSGDSSDDPDDRRHVGSRGPGHTRGKARNKGKSKAGTIPQNSLAPKSTSEVDSTLPSQSRTDQTLAPPERANIARPGSSSNGGASPSTTLVTDGIGNGPEGDSVTSAEGSSGKKRRYQRPMEPLWGLTQGYGPPSKISGLEEPKPEPDWYVKRNPEVNDLHPPVVGSLPKNKKEALWMLQPPPPAAFMEGHTTEPTTRPRSSTRTTRSASSGTNMSNGSQARRGRKKVSRHANGAIERSEDRSASSKEVPRRMKRPAPLKTIKSEGL